MGKGATRRRRAMPIINGLFAQGRQVGADGCKGLRAGLGTEATGDLLRKIPSMGCFIREVESMLSTSLRFAERVPTLSDKKA